MGSSLSWLAVRGKPTDAVLAELSLHPTGRWSLEGEAPFVGASSAAGWFLVVADGSESPLLAPAILTPLSRDCEVITCTVEEHVMFSEATCWRDGRRVWRVTHEGEDGPVGLEVSGELPDAFPDIRADLETQQAAAGGADAGVDFLFDIPVRIVEALTGYRHDEASDAFETSGRDGMEVLEKTAAQGKASWIARLLNR